MVNRAAFFYGTLLHPRVLKRVIGNDGSHLTICPAILPVSRELLVDEEVFRSCNDLNLQEHTRHQIKGCDYPGVVPYDQSKHLFSSELTEDERSVRGNLVVGLSERDVELLDVFEGDEYTRENVLVYKLGDLEPLAHPSQSVISTTADVLPPISELYPANATIYIWTAPTHFLVPELWSYEVFMRDNAWKWVGPTEDREAYLEVDRRREMNGIIDRAADALN